MRFLQFSQVCIPFAQCARRMIVGLAAAEYSKSEFRGPARSKTSRYRVWRKAAAQQHSGHEVCTHEPQLPDKLPSAKRPKHGYVPAARVNGHVGLPDDGHGGVQGRYLSQCIDHFLQYQ